jgi:hypothetical protein
MTNGHPGMYRWLARRGLPQPAAFGASKSVASRRVMSSTNSSSASWLSISSRTSLRRWAVASPGRRAAVTAFTAAAGWLLRAEEVDVLPRATWDGWKSHPAQLFFGRRLRGPKASGRPHPDCVRCDQLLQRAI